MDIELQTTEITTEPIELTTPNVEVCTGDEDIELVVTRKEFNVVGDSIYIGNRIDDTPQWLVDYIDSLNALSLDNKVNEINGLSESLEDLIDAMNVAKNAYTSAIITYEELETMVNAKIETLNSTLSGAEATIINLLSTKVTPTEAQAITTNALQASINDGEIGALIGSVQEAIANESGARATEIDVLTAQLDGFDGTYSTALTGLEATVSSQGGVISAHSTEFTKLNTAITTGNFDTYGASNFYNTLSSEIDGAVIKAGSNFAYDSTLVIGPYAYNSGFGIKSTGSAGTNVTVDGTSYPLWNSEFWIKADNFKMVAASQSAAAQQPFSVNATTGDITFSGKVSFSSVIDTPTIENKTIFPGVSIGAGYTISVAGVHVVYIYSVTATSITLKLNGNIIGSLSLNKQAAVFATPSLSIGQILTVEANGTVVAYVSDPTAIAATIPGTQWYMPTYNTTLVAGTNKQFAIASTHAPGDLIKAINGTTNTTTIDGGRITTGSIRSNQMFANRLVNTSAYNGDGSINESAVTMDINLGTGYIYIK